MTLHAQLENLFKFRINSNEEIIPYIKKLSEAGKFDEPKKVAVLAIILDRLGKMEDEANIERSLEEPASQLEPLPNSQEATPTVDETEQQVTPPTDTAEDTTGTVSEFSLDAIADKPAITSEVEPAPSA